MPRYAITFSGRRKGAVGAPSFWRVEVTADTPDAAIRSLYDRFEHIHMPGARQLPDDAPPLDDYASGQMFGRRDPF